MAYETLLVERAGAVMTVRLNRPQKRNAINNQMHRELQHPCAELHQDFDTRVLVPAGSRTACSAGTHGAIQIASSAD